MSVKKKSLVGWIEKGGKEEVYHKIRKLIISNKKFMPNDIKVRITIQEVK